MKSISLPIHPIYPPHHFPMIECIADPWNSLWPMWIIDILDANNLNDS